MANSSSESTQYTLYSSLQTALHADVDTGGAWSCQPGDASCLIAPHQSLFEGSLDFLGLHGMAVARIVVDQPWAAPGRTVPVDFSFSACHPQSRGVNWLKVSFNEQPVRWQTFVAPTCNKVSMIQHVYGTILLGQAKDFTLKISTDDTSPTGAANISMYILQPELVVSPGQLTTSSSGSSGPVDTGSSTFSSSTSMSYSSLTAGASLSGLSSTSTRLFSGVESEVPSQNLSHSTLHLGDGHIAAIVGGCVGVGLMFFILFLVWKRRELQRKRSVRMSGLHTRFVDAEEVTRVTAPGTEPSWEPSPPSYDDRLHH